MSLESKSNAVSFLGIGCYVPTRRITNQDWEKLTATSDEWIVKNTGIRERSRIEADKTTTDMGILAARQALEISGKSAAEIEFVICGTNSQDDLWPSTASKIQAGLGIEGATSFDIQAGCSGWLFGVRLASSLIRSGEARNALVIGSDALSRFLNYRDRDNMLFGDGSGAAVLEARRTEDANPARLASPIFHTGTIPSRAMELATIYTEEQNAMELYMSGQDMSVARRPVPSMEGKSAMKYALSKSKESLTNVLDQAKALGIDRKDIALYVPHQTNVHVVRSLCDFVEYPFEKIPLIVHKYGGISTAGIPTALTEHHGAGKLKRGDLVLTSAYGAGFTYGAMLFEWGIPEPKKI